jgi:hypothetical protein
LIGVDGSLERIGEHFAAGADHVAIMPLPTANDPFPALELFAANCSSSYRKRAERNGETV